MCKLVTANPERLFYESEEFWDPRRYSEAERRRVRTAWQWLPTDATVLDAGCGNGIFAAEAPRGSRVVSMDRAAAPLSWVAAPRLQADISRLPFATDSFDAVVSLEVLEHLPYDAIEAALDELCRVARRQVLISVPYREDRRAGQVICPHCQCRFHMHYHMRSFDRPGLARLLRRSAPSWTLVRIEGVEPVGSPVFAKGIAWLKRLAPRATFPAHAVCAQCGFRTAEPMLVGRAEKMLAERRSLLKSCWPRRTQPKWWMALYSSGPSHPPGADG